ncbi:hypothetical protein ASPWEDRAFT_109410 [Aspergillus wentii DTO 134E9]|uniref:Uncharacterized protein n=1 Tax=Aspergillus wentii DTO 134E9 TaxID=1073089 RepID=A0A1L9RPK4_ASPWE|nr:uncharacterized protein ASPWEDRAFT_109410 [Aspergillus wentii DTO 134E9]KAI9924079.1 hypothetical protein MW887_007318 [Aspergillus wentii]OJJ36880.1 hypothetical protein ASPWEDRAFT_109410 [Aspergillus wentii DTO 134E9]
MNLSPTVTSSSDSDEPATHPVNDADEDEADQVVGVSISRTQSRMKARKTPAEEKNRVMEHNGGYFETIPDEVDSDGLYLSEITAEPESLPEPPRKQPAVDHTPQEPGKDAGTEASVTTDSDSQRLPKDQRSSFTRSILKSGLPLRSRAWSGGDAFKKFLPDLGSLAKRPSLSFGKSNSNQQRPRSQTVKPSPSRLALEQKEQSPVRPQRPSTSSVNQIDSNGAEEPISELKPLNESAAAKHSFTRRPSSTVGGAPPVLRRSSSDQSLYLRASSTASSLDQRPQYEHIHSQVNSRFKAIKDSLQDSSSRLLSMPTLHLQDIRSDWGYKPFMNDVSQRKGNNYSDEPQPPPEIPTPDPSEPQNRIPRSNSNTLHPILTEAMSEMTGDVVVMGGYRGSILRSAKPPQRQLWVPMKVGLNIRKVDLEVGLNPEDEERMEESIIPSGVLSHVGPVDICRRLIKRLQKCDNAVNGDLRVWDYGYDWRLSPHLLSRKLIKFLEGLPCNAPDVPREKRGAYVIAHSLGGLITRHAVNQRPELFAGVIYAGTPQHCVNILGPLRNGDEVLLSSRVLTAQVNFTFRTSFALLPEDGHCFIDKRTKEEYRVDFFDAKAWDEWRLSPCINLALPPLTGKNFKDNLPLLGKRLSTVLSGLTDTDETNDSSHKAEDLPHPDINHHNTMPQDNRNAPKSTNPFSEVHHKASAMAPSIDGLVGPTSNPKAAPAFKASTTSTIPRPAAIAYLERTLAEVYRFKQELAYNPIHQSENRYPPCAVLYGKSVPTVYGARVWSREQIKHQDAYDDLAFAAGDGVCLASAAMLPSGYRIIKDGLVKSDRGHVGLLGDLEGVGQCLRALVRGRREGVGMSTPLA